MITITISTSSAAFDKSPADEVMQILSNIINKDYITEILKSPEQQINLLDSNQKFCGSIEIW